MLFMTGVAVATVEFTTGALAVRLAAPLLLGIVGTLVGRGQYMRSCLLASLGSTVAMWIGLARDAFFVPRDPSAATEVGLPIWVSSGHFAKDTLFFHFLFVTIEGLILGVVVASFIWGVLFLVRGVLRSNRKPHRTSAPDGR